MDWLREVRDDLDFDRETNPEYNHLNSGSAHNCSLLELDDSYPPCMTPAFADYRSKNFSQQARLVLRLLLHGLSNKEIATYLKLRPSAVKNTIKRMVWQVQIPPDRPQIGLVLMFRDQIDRVDDELGKMRWQRLPARTKEAGMSALENLSSKEIASRLQTKIKAVDQYLDDVRKAIGVSTNLEMVVWYLRRFPVQTVSGWESQVYQKA